MKTTVFVECRTNDEIGKVIAKLAEILSVEANSIRLIGPDKQTVLTENRTLESQQIGNAAIVYYVFSQNGKGLIS